MPEISIIIAVYNVEKYLRKCLDSLINQTFNNIEIICINDGSTDNSLKILKEYKAKDDRIIIVEQENQGPGVARNKGIDIAQGKYIMFVDPDDWLELNACELAYNQIEKNNNDFVIFDYRIYIEESENFIEEKNHFEPYQDVLKNSEININNLKTNFFQNGYSWGKIYNKNFLLNNSIKYLPLYLCEDVPFTFFSILLAKSFSILNIPLYIYRIRTSSACNNADNWKDLFISRRYLLNFIDLQNYKKNILKNYAEYSLNSLLFYFNKFSKDKSTGQDFKKELFEYFDTLSEYQTLRHKIIYFLLKLNLDRLYFVLRKFRSYLQ